jgi:hypothetical protein
MPCTVLLRSIAYGEVPLSKGSDPFRLFCHKGWGTFARPGLLGSPGLVFPTQGPIFQKVIFEALKLPGARSFVADGPFPTRILQAPAPHAGRQRYGSIGRVRDMPEIGAVKSVDVAGRLVVL